jgi:hypothetical protein
MYTSYYEELPPMERDFYYHPDINQSMNDSYSPELESLYSGCGQSIRGYRSNSLPRILPSFYGVPYDRVYTTGRQFRGYPYLERIMEEENSVPYDLNGTGTKISTMNNERSFGQQQQQQQREYVRNSPPMENMHTYYPSFVKLENQTSGLDMNGINFDETFHLNNELIGNEFGNHDENDRKRKFEEEGDLDIPGNGFKLPASKSPIMEAMAFCGIKKWGIEIIQCQDQTDDAPAKVVFRVLDFELYYKYSCSICSKQNPTEDLGSRVKSLRRWFVNFPKKRDRRENPQFSLEVKPDVAKKVYEMIEKFKCQLNVKKRRRTM